MANPCHLRRYQERVVSSVQNVNAIVKMPTGSGKTIVAAEVINRHIATETSRSILFLVPSVELVAQQAEVIEKWCFPNDSSRVSIHHGGVKAPASLPSKSVLVSTADAFMNLQDCKPRHFGWDSFSLCVIDEVHHTIKDHPYRKISLKLSSFRNSTVLMDEEKTSDVDNIQVLCLSASLTYKVSENDIEKAINKLCAELCIQKMESPSHGELIEGGYVPPKDDCIEIETSQEVPAGVVPKYRRKNHDMYGTFMKRIDQRKATEFSLMVHQVVKTLEHMMQAAYSTFKSPLSNCKLKAWEEAAHDKANDYPFHCLPKLLESWYVALRILAQTWEEDEEIVLQWLSCRDAFNVESLDDALLTELVEAVKAHRQTISEHLKVFRLLKHLIDKKERYGDEFRCIVFVQQQITAYVLGEHFINNRCNSNTESESGIKSAYVVSRGSKVTPSIKFNKTMAEKTIEKFRSGEINVLVATSVIEEGFDVPAANVVICYDHMKDSVELCQRFGRARQEERSIVVLDERRDRPLELLQSIHCLQHEIVQRFDPKNIKYDQEAEIAKQRQREASAYKSILVNRECYVSEPLKKLNEYTSKTKGNVDTLMEKTGNEFCCNLTYTNHLQESVNGSGMASSKQAAKSEAALEILDTLQQKYYHAGR